MDLQLLNGVAADSPKRASLVLGLIVFVIFGSIVLLAGWHIVSATGLEGGDFAANSILIQSAKHFTLTLGNYSRVGFNHPGPAILYVLAAGEALFHDRLGWVTPVGGQLIAAMLYNAAWIGIVSVLIRRMGWNVAWTCAVVCIAVAAMAIRDPGDFDNLWFPYLYALPFLTFTVALAAVDYGDRPAWIGLAVAVGFLVNGHVSFVGICGIAVLIVLTESWLCRRLRFSYWPLISAAIFAAFLIPLAVRQLRHTPGPVEEYLAFANANPSHAFGEAFAFMGRHVGTTALEFTFIGLALIVLVARLEDPRYRAVLSATCAVSVGTLYYVVKGVDILKFDYVLIYYGAVPALILGVAIVEMICASRSPLWPIVTAVIAFTAWANAVHADAPMPDYNRAFIQEIDRDMRRLGGERVTFDIVDKHDLNRVWLSILGVEVRRIRDGRPLGFCIAKNWHISYTPLVKCGPDDATNPHFVVDVEGASRSEDLTTVLTSGGLDFLQIKQECLTPGAGLTVATNPLRMANALRSGWSSVEGDFAWSQERKAEITVCVDPEVRSLVLDLQPFLPSATWKQSVSVSVEGGTTVQAALGASTKGSVEIPLPEEHPAQVRLFLDLPNAISPAQAGLSDDRRELAVALRGVRSE